MPGQAEAGKPRVMFRAYRCMNNGLEWRRNLLYKRGEGNDCTAIAGAILAEDNSLGHRTGDDAAALIALRPAILKL